MRGLKKSEGTFKAATRYVDIFVGRVDNVVTIDELRNYIYDIFEVQVAAVINLTIRAEEHKAYMTVKLSEREKLFNAELWPEGIIVNRYYNKSRTASDTTRSNN